VSVEETIEKLVDSKIAKATSGGSQTVLAEYKGLDSQGKGWVVIAGSTESTPITRATVEASEGDTVSVTVGDGQCIMDANISNPSAGVAGVKVVAQTAQQALDDANTAVMYSEIASDAAAKATQSAEDAQQTADSVHSLAEQAQRDASSASTAAASAQAAAQAANDNLKSVVSGATTVEKAVSVMQTALEAIVDYDPDDDSVTEYFWHDANGAHVLGSESGYRNDITSSGMDIKQVSTEDSVASFGAGGWQVGLDDESHMVGDYHSLQLVDKEGNTYFHVSDLRDASGIAQLTEYHNSDGSNTVEVSQGIVSVVSVKVNRVETSDYVVDPNWIRRIIFSTAPVVGSSIEITYTTDSTLAKAYTFGNRDPHTTIGAYSCAEGYGSAASGVYSHAEGTDSESSGYAAHSEGASTEANGTASHAEGVSTKANANYAHAEGESTYAYGIASHSEGNHVYANGDYSHAGGHSCQANGEYSFAHGYGCFAYGDSQTVIGRWNIDDNNNTYALIIGNGNAGPSIPTVFSNALTVDWSGNVLMDGDVQDLSGDAKYLPLAGGTMTSSLTIKSPNIDRDGSNPSSTAYGNSVIFVDKDGEGIGIVRPYRSTAGQEGVQLIARNEVNGSQVENAIRTGVESDGTRSYAVTAPAAFRNAIGMGGTADYTDKEQTSNVSVAASTWTSIASISLDAGTWVIHGNVMYASNSTGRRFAAISSSSPTSATQRNFCANANAVSGGATSLSTMRIEVLTATTTMHVYGWQNSGNALNATGYIEAVRII